MPIQAGIIEADQLPEPGSIYSLTVRRGAEDPRTGMKTTIPLCFRLTVVSASAGGIVLRAPDGPDLTVTIDQFNRQIAPHVVAAYGVLPGPGSTGPSLPPTQAGQTYPGGFQKPSSSSPEGPILQSEAP